MATKEEKALAKLDANYRNAAKKEHEADLKALRKAHALKRKDMRKKKKKQKGRYRDSLASPAIQGLIKDHDLKSGPIPSDIYDGVGSGVEPLGRGGTANVYLVTSKINNHKYALKDVKLGRITDQSKRDMLMAEIPMLKSLDHPNIIKIIEVFRKLNSISIVMEYCPGGELFDRLYDQPDECFTEEDTCVLAKKMIGALRYLHNANIVHRDIKLENFIFTSTEPDAEIKLIDFGFSRQYLEGDEKMTEVVGTCYYVAPEVFKKNYGRAADMWSLGVVIYMMLTGEAPFDGDGNAAIVRDVKRQTSDPKRLRSFITESLQDHGVSSYCVNFVTGLLTVDPRKRLTAEKALSHKWCRRAAVMIEIKLGEDAPARARKSIVRTESNVLKQVMRFSEKSELQRLAVLAAVGKMSGEMLKDLNRAFAKADRNSDGVIDQEEFNELMKLAGIADPSQIEDAFSTVDQDGTGLINYSEFIAAAQTEHAYQERSLIEDAFYALDIDGDGELSFDEVRRMLGPMYDEEHVRAVVRLADVNKDGMISKTEFAQALKSLPIASDYQLSSVLGSDSGSDIRFKVRREKKKKDKPPTSKQTGKVRNEVTFADSNNVSTAGVGGFVGLRKFSKARSETLTLEVEQRTENSALGLGNITDEEVALQRSRNPKGLTDVQLLRIGLKPANSDFEREKNYEAGLGEKTNSEIRAELADINDGDHLSDAFSLYAITDKYRGPSTKHAAMDPKVISGALAWVAKVAPQVMSDDKISRDTARKAMNRILAHCYRFASSAEESNDDARKSEVASLYADLRKEAEAVPAYISLPAESHKMAKEKNLIGAGPKFENPATGPNQAEVSPFLQPEHDDYIKRVALELITDELQIRSSKPVRLDKRSAEEIAQIEKQVEEDAAKLKAIMLVIIAVQINTELDQELRKYASGWGELTEGVPVKRLEQILNKSRSRKGGDIGSLFDIARRSFTGKTPADHREFTKHMIFSPGHRGRLTAVRVKDSMGDEKASVKKMIVNATYQSEVTYGALVKRIRNEFGRKKRGPFRRTFIDNNQEEEVVRKALQVLALPSISEKKVAQIIEVQCYYPDFLEKKKIAHPLYRIARANSLKALAKDCSEHLLPTGPGKDFGYIPSFDDKLKRLESVAILDS